MGLTSGESPASTEGSSTDLPFLGSCKKVIIKADDFCSINHPGGGWIADKVDPKFVRFSEIIKARHIKASIGVIAKGLDSQPMAQQWIKEQKATGLFEFWLHAWDHCSWTGPDGVVYNESSIPYELQMEHMRAAQAMSIEKLGGPFVTYSPPGTPGKILPAGALMGANLRNALRADPFIKVVMYPGSVDVDSAQMQSEGKITILNRIPCGFLDIENPIFVPNFTIFQTKLAAARKNYPQREYFWMQGHPWHWTDHDFEEFEKILDFLTTDGVVFTTPFEYAEELRRSGHRPYGY